MSFKYPYQYQLRKELQQSVSGSQHRVWQSKDISELAKQIKKPVIEIGGPTEEGFFFANDVVFSHRPVITNITRNPQPYSHNAKKLSDQVDELMDATAMPYDNNSVGIFLMAAMSLSSDWWVELSDKEKDEATDTFDSEFIEARFETGQVATGIRDIKSVKDAQRIKIYLEVARCLEKGGLFFTDGGVEEIIILQKIGFELIASLQILEENEMSYDFVVAKRF